MALRALKMGQPSGPGGSRTARVLVFGTWCLRWILRLSLAITTPVSPDRKTNRISRRHCRTFTRSARLSLPADVQVGEGNEVPDMIVGVADNLPSILDPRMRQEFVRRSSDAHAHQRPFDPVPDEESGESHRSNQTLRPDHPVVC